MRQAIEKVDGGASLVAGSRRENASSTGVICTIYASVTPTPHMKHSYFGSSDEKRHVFTWSTARLPTRRLSAVAFCYGLGREISWTSKKDILPRPKGSRWSGRLTYRDVGHR